MKELIPNPIEIESVLKLDVNVRLEYLIKRISSQDLLVSIETKEGYSTLFGNNEFPVCLPIFPNTTFAKRYIQDTAGDEEPSIITRSEFISKWVNRMINDGYGIIPFPVYNPIKMRIEGAVLSPQQLRDMIISQIVHDYGEYDE
ncbi:MAG: DUF2750 domain-containing protein [Candidatus Sumerlaeia bacterium]|nr:DUF2750 domain-containing protein [Candidatus Sumerlaeia bacterium]